MKTLLLLVLFVVVNMGCNNSHDTVEAKGKIEKIIPIYVKQRLGIGPTLTTFVVPAN